MRLFELYKQFGNNWKEISRRLGHPNNSVKNHFYGSVRRNQKDIQIQGELQDLLRDKEMRGFLLRPNYGAKKRSKPMKEGLRRSERVKNSVKYRDTLSDDELPGVGTDQVEPVQEKLPPEPFIYAPQSIRLFDISEEFLNISQPFVLPSFKRFGLRSPNNYSSPSPFLYKIN